MNDHKESNDLNRDPITGAPGSHPVGVGVGGVAGGAAAGALAGTMFGPIGTLIGAAAGVVVGAAAGKGVAERIDPTGETEYWRDEYKNRPYVGRHVATSTATTRLPMALACRLARTRPAAPGTIRRTNCSAAGTAHATPPRWRGTRPAARYAIPGIVPIAPTAPTKTAIATSPRASRMRAIAPATIASTTIVRRIATAHSRVPATRIATGTTSWRTS